MAGANNTSEILEYNGFYQSQTLKTRSKGEAITAYEMALEQGYEAEWRRFINWGADGKPVDGEWWMCEVYEIHPERMDALMWGVSLRMAKEDDLEMAA